MRGVNGVYHHMSKRHLHRYLSEFGFRYNARNVTDTERAIMAVQGADGKRLPGLIVESMSPKKAVKASRLNRNPVAAGIGGANAGCQRLTRSVSRGGRQ